MSPATTGENEDRKTMIDVVATIALIRNAVHADGASELITYENGDVAREHLIQLKVNELAPTPSSDSASPRHFGLLLATPERGRLVSISDLEDGDGNPVDVMSHEDHTWVAFVLLVTLAGKVLEPWHADDQAAAEHALIKLVATLELCIEDPPELAVSRVKKLFQTEGQLTGIPATAPLDQNYLRELKGYAHLLAEHYLLLAKVAPSSGRPIRLRYTERANYYEVLGRWDRAKMLVGGHPPYIQVECPWARRTDRYDVSHKVSEGHYAKDQFTFYARTMTKPGSARRRAKSEISLLPDSMQTIGTGLPSSDNSRSIARPHLIVQNGSRAEHPISTMFLTHERPLGSAGSTWVTSFLTSCVTGVLALIAWKVPLQNISSPALILAIIAAIGAFAASIPTPSTGASVLSRLLLLVNAVAAVVYCWAWIVLQDVAPPGEVANLKTSNGLILVLSGVVIGGVFVAATWRLRRSVKNFGKAVQHGAPKPTSK